MNKRFCILFKDLCCSRCKSDFDESSVQIVRQEPSMLVLKLVCPVCHKDFGIAFLGISASDFINDSEERQVLKIQEDLPPITDDDVLNAHEFIKNLDEHWSKYLP